MIPEKTKQKIEKEVMKFADAIYGKPAIDPKMKESVINNDISWAEWGYNLSLERIKELEGKVNNLELRLSYFINE